MHILFKLGTETDPKNNRKFDRNENDHKVLFGAQIYSNL